MRRWDTLTVADSLDNARQAASIELEEFAVN